MESVINGANRNGNQFAKGHVEGLPAPKGDDVYTLFGKTALHPFIRWVDEVFSIKTPELKRKTIVSAITYGTSRRTKRKHASSGRRCRGGVEFEDNHPTSVLDAFLKSASRTRGRWT